MKWIYIIRCLRIDFNEIGCIGRALSKRDVWCFGYETKTQLDLIINFDFLLRRRFFQSIEWKNRWFSKSSNPFFPSRSSTEQINCCNKSFPLLDTFTLSGNDNGTYTKSIPFKSIKMIPNLLLTMCHNLCISFRKTFSIEWWCTV